MHIVVIGGGFGGIACLKRMLSLLPYETYTLISENEHFVFTPLFIDALVDSALESKASRKLSEIFTQKNCSLVIDKVTQVDLDQRAITAQSGRKMTYDKLIFSQGSRTHFYGIEGAQEHCFSYKTANDIPLLRQKIRKNDFSTVAIIGAGATGIELACALRKLLPEKRIVLVELLDILLPQVSAGFRKKALAALAGQKIELLLQHKVSKIGPNTLFFADGNTLQSSCNIWTAGIAPNEIPTTPAAEKKKGAFTVDAFFHLKGRTDAFAIGDCAYLEQSPLPATAQAAEQSGKAVAGIIAAEAQGKAPKPFQFTQKGFILSLGDKAIGNFFGMTLDGKFAKKLRDWYYGKKFKEMAG